MRPSAPARRILAAALTLTAAHATAGATTARFDPAPAWPLCGRIAEDPPVGWTPGDGCPAERFGDAAFSDFPLSDSFGPRLNGATTEVYDWHRGIDLPTGVGTPVFAVADGTVTRVEADAIEIRHLRPGALDCASGGGCYTSRYRHLAGIFVALDEVVPKGGLVAETSAGDTGFPHLHLELRDAPPDDPESAWQRDTVHPLALLPYPDAGAARLGAAIVAVDASDPLRPVVDVEATLADVTELDLARVEVRVFERRADGDLWPVPQPGAVADANGYHAAPPWLDGDERNFLYTHKDSFEHPWSSFADCPYAADHPPSYAPNVHVDARLGSPATVGAFDGTLVAPAYFDTTSTSWSLTVRFLELVGVDAAESLCIVAEAWDVRGARSQDATGCGALISVDGFEDGTTRRWLRVEP